MLAWMNDEANERTRETGEAWFWSRSRQGALAQGRDVGQHAGRGRAARRLRRRRAAPARAPDGPRVSHRLRVVLRAVAVARRRRAREGASGGLVHDVAPRRRRRRLRAQGRRGSGRGRGRRARRVGRAPRVRRSPTSGSTPTCCSPRAASTRARSRTSWRGAPIFGLRDEVRRTPRLSRRRRAPPRARGTCRRSGPRSSPGS